MKRRNRRRTRFQPGDRVVQVSVEQVESRCLLAGIVGVSLTNAGNLVITGDAVSNQIEIGNVNSDFGYVTGYDGTLIEYEGIVAASMQFPLTTVTTAEGDFPGLEGNLNINLGNGHDEVLILGTDGPLAPLVIGGNMDINFGNGNDYFEQTISWVGGDVEVRAGKGYDAIELRELYYANEAYVNTGDSNATDLLTADRAHFLGDAELRGGNGHTQIIFIDGTAQGELEINSGSGDDEIVLHEIIVGGDLDIDTGAADSNVPGDVVMLGNAGINGDLNIDGRGGSQTIGFLGDTFFGVVGDTSINTRGGDDVIMIQDLAPTAFLGDAEFKTGGGHDTIGIGDQTQFDGALSLKLGAGHDNILFDVGVTVSGQGELKGGGGSDSIDADYLFATWSQGIPDLLSIENVI